MDGLMWVKSSACESSSCVEVAFMPLPVDPFVLVRSPDGGVVSYSYDEWRDFVGGVKAGEFDVED